MNSPNAIGDFNGLLVECINETIVSLLSRQVADALYARLEKDHSIGKDQLPDRLDMLLSTLEKPFGRRSVEVVGRTIARRFYSKLGLNFYNVSRKNLIEYVEQAKLMLANQSSNGNKA